MWPCSWWLDSSQGLPAVPRQPAGGEELWEGWGPAEIRESLGLSAPSPRQSPAPSPMAECRCRGCPLGVTAQHGGGDRMGLRVPVGCTHLLHVGVELLGVRHMVRLRLAQAVPDGVEHLLVQQGQLRGQRRPLATTPGTPCVPPTPNPAPRSPSSPAHPWGASSWVRSLRHPKAMSLGSLGELCAPPAPR